MAQTRVLVIDDDAASRDFMSNHLRAGGCEVHVTGSPIGVSKLVTHYQINVVVIDIVMPDISGDKLAKLLRGNPRMSEIAIVLVSGGDPEHLKRLAKTVDADAAVSKSDIRAQLTLVVQNANRKRTLARSIAK
jgi:CheY-like chemotaxis protein